MKDSNSQSVTDEEVKKILQRIKSRKDTHPDYISDELESLQATVLASHARLENALETRIILQLRKNVGTIDDAVRYKIVAFIRQLLVDVSFRNKLNIIEGYKDATDNLIKLLQKTNTYRNEFAHPDGMELRGKYNFNEFKSKENIRNILRCFDQAEREMDNYFIKIDGVPKMREK